MALSIKNAGNALPHELASRTGETITQVIVTALREKLKREKGRRRSTSLREDLLEISRRCAALPDLDTRTPDEILGYDDECGLPG